MAGFEFQITQVVLELIRSEDAGGGLVLMEALSDILREDGGLVVSQLKRTLSSSALHKALDELWQIEQLARQTVPKIRPSIRYQVQSARRDLKGVEASIARWTPKPPFDPSHLADFKARVVATVVVSPRLEAARILVERFIDPSPFHTVDRFAGILLRVADGAQMEAAADEIRIVLAGMRASAADRAVEFRLWGVNDRAPSVTAFEPDAKKAVRVGQRLGIMDLTAGRLADRLAYRAIHAGAEEWLAANADGAEKIPTFWIEGRSGAGKSAALLHLLAKLHEEDPQRVIVWLGPRSERIGDVLKKFRDVVEDGQQLIVAIDDPLAPDQQQSFISAVQVAADEWTRLIGAGDREATPLPPALVCCGPTEQREFGEDNCFAELEITGWPLQPESAEDVEELAEWYARRTGKRPPELTGDVLLVQRFFEWDLGTIRDFALRFRQRLEGFRTAGPAVFDLIARILAFGRLYADYPASLLQAATSDNPGVGRALDQLSEEEAHLTFRADGEGVRLTHPHLADAIYREWFGRNSDSRARKQHLSDGIRAALAQVQSDPGVRLAPLWALARLKRGGRPWQVSPDLRDRLNLIEAEVRELLTELYSDLAPQSLGPTDLPVWVVLNEAFSLALHPDPSSLLMATIDGADAPAQGLRLSCHVLLASAGLTETSTVRQSVAGLLHRLVDWRDDEGRPWRDWAYVSADLIDKGSAFLVIDDLLRLIERAPKWQSLRVPVGAVARKASPSDAKTIVSAWLAATQDTPYYWSSVLHLLHDRGLSVTDLGERTARFLLAAPRHRAWPTIWKSAIERGALDTQMLEELGLAWLGLRPEAGIPIAGFEAHKYYKVLSYFIVRKPTGFEVKLQDLGLAWIDQANHQATGWSAIWSALWEDDDLSEAKLRALRSEGLVALKDHPSNREWSFIWHSFVNKPRWSPIDEILAIGFDWLRNVPFRHSGWVYVWETLHDKTPRRGTFHSDLCSLADRWLLESSQHRGWAAVWEKLRQDPAVDQTRLLDMARDWLVQAPIDHPAWRIIAHVIGPRTQHLDPMAHVLSQSARAWLQCHPDDRYWPRVLKDFRHLLSASDTAKFESDALDNSRRNGGPTPRLFRSILSAKPNPETRKVLLDELCVWLVDHFDDGEWTMAWTLAASSENPPISIDRLLDLAKRWTEEQGPTARGWPYLWPTWRYILRKHFPETITDHANDVLACLMSLPLSHPRWAAIWTTLRHDAPHLLQTPDALAKQGAWLRQWVRDVRKWAEIFKLYREAGGDWESDPLLAERLADWLEVAEGSEPRWPEVWRAAHKLNPDDPNLLNKAEVWLRNETPSQRSWAFIWRLFVRAASARRTVPQPVLELGARWLAENDAHPEWHKMRSTFEQYCHGSDDGSDVIVAKIRAAPEAPSALPLWLSLRRRRSLLADGLDKETLMPLVLAADITQPGWSLAWRSLLSAIDAADFNEALGRCGLKWLQRPEFSAAWPFVWRNVWEHWPDLHTELRPIGRDWLRGRDFKTPGRNFIQRALFGRPSGAKK